MDPAPHKNRTTFEYLLILCVEVLWRIGLRMEKNLECVFCCKYVFLLIITRLRQSHIIFLLRHFKDYSVLNKWWKRYRSFEAFNSKTASLNDDPNNVLAKHNMLVVFPVPGGPWNQNACNCESNPRKENIKKVIKYLLSPILYLLAR